MKRKGFQWDVQLIAMAKPGLTALLHEIGALRALAGHNREPIGNQSGTILEPSGNQTGTGPGSRLVPGWFPDGSRLVPDWLPVESGKVLEGPKFVR